MNYTNASAESDELAVSPPVTDNRLSRRWLVLARLMALSLWGLSVGLFVTSIPSYFAFLHRLCTGTTAACSVSLQLTPHDLPRLQELGLSLDFFATYIIVVTSLFALGYWVVAALLFWRKSDNRLALFAVVFLGTFPITFSNGFISILLWPWGWLVHGISFLGNLCIVLFFYVFPTGHFVPRWTRFILLPTLVYGGFNEFFPDAPFNPFFRFPVLNGVSFLSVVGGIVLVQLYRYRRVSTPLERQQTKWVVYGVSMGVGGFLVLISLFTFLPVHFQNGSLAFFLFFTAIYGLMLLLPLSLGVAVLRSRLWQIDRIINRTLVYGTLTASLALIYVGLVIGLQALLRGIISQDNSVAIVISTLAIAALFQPLRKRIQNVIDRRFYRRKYDAAQILQAFSASLRTEADLDQLSEQLVAVVQETIQPAHVSLWVPKAKQPAKDTAQFWASDALAPIKKE